MRRLSPDRHDRILQRRLERRKHIDVVPLLILGSVKGNEEGQQLAGQHLHRQKITAQCLADDGKTFRFTQRAR